MSKAAELAALIGSQTALSNRNMIINGAMQVAQRGTSSTDFFYASVDRFQLSKNATDNLAITQSQDSDNPAGQGFGSSFKVNITTAESALAADENMNFHQRIEGQNLQRLEKGTSNAKSSTVSFWVKSNTTGTYVLELFDNDNNRHAAKTYTIDSANTWEKKTITFVGDTTGALDNDANRSMDVRWWLAAGSNFTSGTLPTGWASLTTANRAVGQVNLMASTNNWYITGIQWEVGDVATAFEHRSFSDELRRCQRYYYQLGPIATDKASVGMALCTTTTTVDGNMDLPVTMRTAPTGITTSGTASDYDVRKEGTVAISTSVPSFTRASKNTIAIRYTSTTGHTVGQSIMMRLRELDAFIGTSGTEL
jgi:hypothetical protein